MKKLSLLITVALLLMIESRVQADEVRYLSRNEQFIAAVVSAIQSAKKSIDITYFIYEPCHPSTKFIRQLLVKKAQQGVRIRFLLDAVLYKKKIRQAMAKDFAEAGIEFKTFNPRLYIDPSVNFRTHVKLLLIDKSSYISGGRNIADEYFGFAPVYNFIDADVWVSGRSAKQASASFEELWSDRASRAVNLKGAKPAPLSELCKTSEAPQSEKWTQRVHKFMSQTAKKASSLVERHSCKTRFVSDNPRFYFTGTHIKEKHATAEFLNFVAGTHDYLEMENWSYMPLQSINDELKILRQRNVPILVMTNMDADNKGIIKNAEDFLNHRFASRDTKGSQVVLQLSSRGHLSDRHRMTPTKSYFRLHQKTAIRDGRDVMVGSFNIDPRSYHTNLESTVVVEDCPSLIQEYTHHASELVQTYHKDLETGFHKTPPPPHLGTILFSVLGFHLL